MSGEGRGVVAVREGRGVVAVREGRGVVGVREGRGVVGIRGHHTRKYSHRNVDFSSAIKSVL